MGAHHEQVKFAVVRKAGDGGASTFSASSNWYWSTTALPTAAVAVQLVCCLDSARYQDDAGKHG